MLGHFLLMNLTDVVDLLTSVEVELKFPTRNISRLIEPMKLRPRSSIG